MVAALADALERCWTVFLADPQWGQGMVQGMLDAVQPQLIVGPDRWTRMKARFPETDLIPEIASPSRINVPTGGTTGQLKFASHTGRSLEAAALGFLDFFGEDSHVALCALPLYHVSGLMQVVPSRPLQWPMVPPFAACTARGNTARLRGLAGVSVFGAHAIAAAAERHRGSSLVEDAETCAHWRRRHASRL